MPRNKPIPISELVGKQFGLLTIIREAERHERRVTRERNFICKCECGNTYTAGSYQLLNHVIKSCGCQKDDHKHKHGHATNGAPSRVYGIWHSMVQRTTNPNASNHHNYLGRGITLDDEHWLKFPNFLADMGEPPTAEFSLERRTNSRGYSKENCYWATWTEQCRNTRQNRLITFKDQTHCISEWAEIMGLSHKIISYRLGAGWSVEDVLTTPRIPRSQIRTWKSRKLP